MGTLLTLFFVFLLLVCSAVFAGLTIGLYSLGHYELKRKAQLGNKDAKRVYPILARGHQLLVTLLLGNVLVNSAITVLLDSIVYGVFAILITAIVVTVFGEILPMAYLKKHGLRVGARFAPVIIRMLWLLSPIAAPLGRLLDKMIGSEHPSIYSKEELYKIFEEHQLSEYSDIDEDEVRIVRHALSFGDKYIREVMTPKRAIKMVKVDDSVGPVLMQELHDSGHSRFPVYKGTPDNIVGVLYLRELVLTKASGSVKDLMSSRVYFVREEKQLGHALEAFLKTKNHLFIVVNSFEEVVGVITIEDIIEQIIGRRITDEFDKYDDIRAVAQLEANEVRSKRVGKTLE